MDHHSPNQPIRIVFLGTPEFSVPCLRSLLASDAIEVLGALTQPDRPSGRGQKLTPPPVKVVAQEAGLTVLQPKSLRKEPAMIDWLREQKPDFLVTIAFGQILSQEVLDVPRYGTINVHASLLPEYRGPNPIQWAILDGKTETGLTTMLTDIGVDTGDMLLKETIVIPSDITTGELTVQLSEMAGPLLIQSLQGVASGEVKPEPQDHEASTHAPKLKKEDAFLDWNLPTAVLHNKIRSQQPWPGTTTLLEGQLVKIIRSRATKTSSAQNDVPGTILGLVQDWLDVVTGDGVIEILEVQPAGKKAMSARDWANGALRGKLNADEKLCFQAVSPEENL